MEQRQITNGGGEEEEKALQDMPELFSSRKPRDALAGLSSGLKNFGKGVAAGVGTLVGAPIIGARQGGVVGCAKGLGAGAIAAVVLPTAGAFTGVKQIVRGVANTPAAFSANSDEKIWDAEKRVWYAYNLPEEAKELLGSSEAESRPRSRQVVDTKLYDLLDVSPHATRSEIKKAYYRQAIKLHPDKNPDDPNANANFQEIGSAYQILQDDNLRASYDQNGSNSVEKAELLDSSQLYELVFGSANFEPLVGELRLMMVQNVSNLQGLDEEMENESDEVKMQEFERRLRETDSEMQRRQKRRAVQCAVNLERTLSEFVDSEDDGVSFKAKIESEAAELASTPFGGALIGVVAYVYQEQSQRYLGFKHGIGSGLGFGKVKKAGHVFANKCRLLSSAVQAMNASRREEKKKSIAESKARSAVEAEQSPPASTTESDSAASGGGGERASPRPDTATQSRSQSAPDAASVGFLVNALWQFVVMDVESTLRSVCRKVFKDCSVPRETRQKRAQGLLVIAEVFSKSAQTPDAGLSDITSKLNLQHL